MSGRILAVDYGRKRIGIAISDPLGISMKTLGHISRESDTQAAKILSALIQNENASELVIGLPLHSHGDARRKIFNRISQTQHIHCAKSRRAF